MRTSNRGRAASPFRYSPLVAALACAFTSAHAAGPFVVTSAADFGAGTLRDALSQAVGACSGGDATSTIEFAIPGTGPFTIQPSAPLPSFPCANPMSVVIDGYSQNQSPLQIVIDGSNYSYGSPIFDTSSFSYGGDSFLDIRGLEITNFTAFGPVLSGNIALTGSRVWNNGGGVRLIGGGTIGGASAAERNVISNNNGAGIEVDSGSASIVNNFIGVGDDGVTPAGNSEGIYVGSAASATIQGNVIAFNNGSGVYVDCSGGHLILDNVISANYGGIVFYGVSGATVTGNKIGVGGDGATPMGNYGEGIALNSSGCQMDSQQSSTKDFPLGGSNANSILSNYISYNYGGIYIGQGGNNLIDSNTLRGNYFGGIYVSSGSDNEINGNTIAENDGDGVALWTDGNGLSGNTINANNGDGVYVIGVGNRLLGNGIFDNSSKNINLDFYGGPLPNDLGDADVGANNLQNHPDVNLVTQDGTSTSVGWSFNSTPNTSFTLEFFANDSATAPAGRTPLLQVPASTDGSGNASGTQPINGLHDFIAMTATNDASRDTSEFSAIVALTPTPGVLVTPTQLAFGDVFVGATSAPQNATVKSTGTAPYSIGLIVSGSSCYGGPPAPPPMCSEGEFTCSTTCATSTPYATGQQCTFTASFSPSSLGTQAATITLCDNATGSPRTITLTGSGIAPPAVFMTPSGFDFGLVPAGGFSEPHSFVVNNSGTVVVSLEPPVVSGPFELVSTTCTSALAAASSCESVVRFAPTVGGAASGQLTMQTSSGPASASLAGTGTVQAILEYSREPINMGTTQLNGAPLGYVLQLRNAGNASLVVNGVTITSPFTATHDCPPVLLPSATCNVTLGFVPTAVGPRSGQLNIMTDVPGGSSTIPVTALVQANPEPLIVTQPQSIGFGERIGGTQSGNQRIVIRNDGGVAANISLATSGLGFLLTATDCGATLDPQAACFADIAFAPNTFGPRDGSFIVTSNAPGSPNVVLLSGVGCRPFVTMGHRFGRTGANCAP